MTSLWPEADTMFTSWLHGLHGLLWCSRCLHGALHCCLLPHHLHCLHGSRRSCCLHGALHCSLLLHHFHGLHGCSWSSCLHGTLHCCLFLHHPHGLHRSRWSCPC